MLYDIQNLSRVQAIWVFVTCEELGFDTAGAILVVFWRPEGGGPL